MTYTEPPAQSGQPPAWAGTVADALAHAAATRPGTAYIDGGREWSWRQVAEASAHLAAQLRQRGLGRGDRIGIILPNQIEWLLTYFAAAQIGAAVVGLNVRYRETELDFMLADGRVKAVLAPAQYAGFDYVDFFARRRGQYPQLEHAWFLADTAVLPDGADFRSLLQPGAAPVPVGTASPDDLLMVIYTSGTTGRPKAAGLTHRSQLASAWAQCTHTRMAADDLLQLAMPFNHVGGITCGILAMLLGGGTCELVPAFHPDTVLEMAHLHPPTLLVGVPTMLTLLLMSPRLAEADFSRLRLIVVGGSTVDAPLLHRLQEAFPGVAFMNLYGLSETSGAIIMTPWDAGAEALVGSIGAPLAGARVRIADAQGATLAAGEVGEICVHGAGVIPAYVGSHGEGAAFDDLGWLSTGDMGGGENVYPAEVEQVLYRHPGIAEVAVIGSPDARWGEAVTAVVVPKAGAQIDEAGLIAWCRERLVPRVPGALQVPARGAVHRRAAAHRHRQGAQARVAPALDGGRRCRAALAHASPAVRACLRSQRGCASAASGGLRRCKSSR